MATRKQEVEVVRLEHVNGATVSVAADRAETLIAGGQFTAASGGRKQPAKPADEK
jgi:hypothetical protein